MEKNYFDELKMRLYKHCDWMNSQAKEGDLLRNHTNYGSASMLVSIMKDFGHDVDIRVYGDGDYLISDKIIIDKEVFIDFGKYNN